MSLGLKRGQLTPLARVIHFINLHEKYELGKGWRSSLRKLGICEIYISQNLLPVTTFGYAREVEVFSMVTEHLRKHFTYLSRYLELFVISKPNEFAWRLGGRCMP